MLVVSLITVKPEPKGRLEVTGTTSVAVVDSNPPIDEFPGAVEVANEEEPVAGRAVSTEFEAGTLGKDVFADRLLLAATDGMLLTSVEVGEAAAASEVELPYTPGVTELSDGKPVDGTESWIEVEDDNPLPSVAGILAEDVESAVSAPTSKLVVDNVESGTEGTVSVNVIVLGAVRCNVVVSRRVLVNVVWLPVPQ